MTTKKESIIVIYDEEKNITAIIHRNETLKKNIILKTIEMSDEEIAELITDKLPTKKVEKHD